MTYYLYGKTQTAMERYLCLITDVVVCTLPAQFPLVEQISNNFITSFAEKDPRATSG